MKIIESLINAIRQAANYNKDTEIAPVCILWPDKDRQWEPLIPRLRSELPELLTFGDYNPSQRTGPAIWLKYIIAPKNQPYPPHLVPIIYLPGYQLQDLQPNKQCPELLKPLVELQYRGTTWTQPNGRDWTVYDFLTTCPSGPRLKITDTPQTSDALLRSLPYLCDENYDILREKHLDNHSFNELSLGGDWQRHLLQFLDDNQTYRSSRSDADWQSFVETCKNRLHFDPVHDTVTAGITLLVNHEPPWQSVWDRFNDSYRKYPNIPIQIHKLPYNVTAGNANDKNHGWPQWHQDQENILREELKKITQYTLHKANDTLAKLNEIHKERRTGVWSDLGETPLAHAVSSLTLMLDNIIDTPNTGDFRTIENAYCQRGWEIDKAMVNTLAKLEKHDDIAVIISLLKTFYLPWADQMAQRLQDLVNQNGYPTSPHNPLAKSFKNAGGECILFIDGLRFDQSKELSQRLSSLQYQVVEEIAWVPLPTVTATCKPALSPIRHLFTGPGTTSTFEPATAENIPGNYSNQQFHRQLDQAGWQVIPPGETGDITQNAWTEYGDTDKRGHSSGWKLVKELDRLLDEIITRIKQLTAAGWKKIHIITDHGWLLFPGGLPKTSLPRILTDTRWGRCALIKPGARCKEQLFPWHWNSDIIIGLAHGIHCYKKGIEYAHGGLSFQESLTLQLTITTPGPIQIQIQDISWKRLRCNVTITITGDSQTLFADIIKTGTSLESIAEKVKRIDENGRASLLVEDEIFEGWKALLIIRDEQNRVLKQSPVIIGGETL